MVPLQRAETGKERLGTVGGRMIHPALRSQAMGQPRGSCAAGHHRGIHPWDEAPLLPNRDEHRM